MKGVIAATNLCFAEKGIYTSEVLAIVLTQLLEVGLRFLYFFLHVLSLRNLKLYLDTVLELLFY